MTSAIPSPSDLNLVVLTGRVAHPPQFHYQPNGTPVLQFSLELMDSERVAETRQDRQQHGYSLKQARGRPALVNIVALGPLAQSRSKLQSGEHLMVKGRLHQRRWQTSEGKNRTRTEVIASELRSVEPQEVQPVGERSNL